MTDPHQADPLDAGAVAPAGEAPDTKRATQSPRAGLLAQIRAARPARAPARATIPAARAELARARRPRLVFAFDATASRADTWASAQKITSKTFSVIPGALDVALAVHGGDSLHTFTEFSADVDEFRQHAAAITCVSGTTQLCEIMARTLDAGGVRVLSYIGDAFEEDVDEVMGLSDRFKLRGIPVVLLADQAEDDTLAVYRAIADRTGGAVLDFRASKLRVMGEMLVGVATLAIGGRKLLEAQGTAGARLLIEHLPRSVSDPSRLASRGA